MGFTAYITSVLYTILVAHTQHFEPRQLLYITPTFLYNTNFLSCTLLSQRTMESGAWCPRTDFRLVIKFYIMKLVKSTNNVLLTIAAVGNYATQLSNTRSVVAK